MEKKTIFYLYVNKEETLKSKGFPFGVVFQDSNGKGSLFIHLYKVKKQPAAVEGCRFRCMRSVWPVIIG